MTIKLIDAAFETTTTTGSGPYTLQGSQPGHQSFASAGNYAKVLYQVNDGNASGVITQREVGIGTVTVSGGVTAISRDTILFSTNSNSAINWNAGTKNVIGSIAAAALPVRDENLNFVEGFGTIAGAANALTLTLPVTPLAYSDGMQIAGFFAATNTTAGATIAVNGLSVKPLKYKGADPGIANLSAGQLLVARYSAANGWFELISPSPSVTIASQAEAEAGIENAKLMTPLRTKQAIARNSNRAFSGSGSTATSVGSSAVTLLTVTFTPKYGDKPIRVSAFGTFVVTAGNTVRYQTRIKNAAADVPGTITDFVMQASGYSGSHAAKQEIAAPGNTNPITFTLVANTETSGKTCNATSYSLEVEEIIN